jgi:hypothetical protein
MTLDELKQLDDPGSLGSDHLRAIWYDLHGDWDTAHTIVQNLSDLYAAWIHAYLHRKEPDIWNSKYWYRRCGRPYPGDLGFEEEMTLILSELS